MFKILAQIKRKDERLHHKRVGAKWDELGRLQFKFMIDQGLKPTDTLLDLGCGSLRGGIHYIRYLNRHKYLGLDRNKELINDGLKYELSLFQRWLKKPRFVVSRDFEVERFDQIPDYVILQSVFSHLNAQAIAKCLRKIHAFAPHAKIYATFNLKLKKNLASRMSSNNYRYSVDEMVEMAKKSGLASRYIGDWNHPRHQKMIHFYNSRSVNNENSTSVKVI